MIIDMKSIIITIISFLPTLILAQGGWVNDGATVQVSTGTDLRIESGGVTSLNNGSITNLGNLYLDLDWMQTGATTTYTGTGWMWFEGNNDQNISSVSALTVPQLRVDNGNKLILNSTINVSTGVDLMNNGNIELGANNLVINTGATISNYDPNNYVITNATGFLQQEVTISNVFFPIGNSTYNPATLLNVGTTDNFQARVEDIVYDNGTSGTPETIGVVNRTWHIDEEINGGSDVTLSVEWEVGEELAFNRNNCGVAHWDGSQWDHPTAYTAAINTSGTYYMQTRSDINTFSPFALEDEIELLPVELLSFTAARQNQDQVQLKWSTESELNNQGFEVERMLENEQEWTFVEWVDGVGNSSSLEHYDYLDENSFEGISYYRLRQLDYDGTETYSQIRDVEGIANSASSNLTLFPNPTQDIINVRFNNSTAQSATILVYAADGSLLFEQQEAFENNSVIQLNQTKYLPAGTYFMRAITNDGVSVSKNFVKISY
jgi:hypothetical protein